MILCSDGYTCIRIHLLTDVDLNKRSTLLDLH